MRRAEAADTLACNSQQYGCTAGKDRLMRRTPKKTIDHDKMQAFVGQAITDCGAALSAALVVIGDELGLYKAMAGAGPLSAGEIAERTGTDERHLREWLINQAVSRYLEYDVESDRFSLPDEHAIPLTD